MNQSHENRGGFQIKVCVCVCVGGWVCLCIQTFRPLENAFDSDNFLLEVSVL